MRFELTRAEPNRLPTDPVVLIAGDRLNHSAILSTLPTSPWPCVRYLHERVVTLVHPILVLLGLLCRANTGAALLGTLLFCNSFF